MKDLPIRPVLGLYALHLASSRATWRASAAYAIAIPIGFFFWADARLGATLGASRLLVGALVLSSLVAVTRELGRTVAADRCRGTAVLLATTGMSSGRYLAALAVEASTLGLVPLAVIAIVGVTRPALLPGSAAWLAPYGLAVLTMAALGATVAQSSRSEPTATTLVNVVVVVQLGLCPLLYPSDRVPEVIAPIVDILPATLAVESIAAVWEGQFVDPRALALLGLWCALMGTIAFLLHARSKSD